jgi:hypothetical protein
MVEQRPNDPVTGAPIGGRGGNVLEPRQLGFHNDILS